MSAREKGLLPRVVLLQKRKNVHATVATQRSCFTSRISQQIKYATVCMCVCVGTSYRDGSSRLYDSTVSPQLKTWDLCILLESYSNTTTGITALAGNQFLLQTLRPDVSFFTSLPIFTCTLPQLVSDSCTQHLLSQ